MTADVDRGRLRHALVVLLAVNSGATDALGFVALGGVFTSVMTGNMVLFGLSLARPDATLTWHALLAICCFVAGCAFGTRVAGSAHPDDPLWPASVQRALTIQLVLTVLFAIGYECVVGHQATGLRFALLAVNALALGMQSSTVQRFGVPGLSTTYLTGTLTAVVIRLASGHGLRQVRSSAALLLGLVVGAVAGGALAVHAPRWAPLVSLVCLAGPVLVGRHPSWLHRHDPAGDRRPAKRLSTEII